MRRHIALAVAASLIVACGGSQPKTAPTAAPLALEGLNAQRLVVLPTYASIVAPELTWAAPMRRNAETLRSLDAEIAGALTERGLGKTWVFPEELQRTYKRNPTYASDPYALGEEPLRSSALVAGTRLPEPLASQLRTLVALTDARYALAPVEMRIAPFPKDSSGRAQPTLKLVILDARLSEVKWVGQVKGDTISAVSPAIVATLGARVADLFAER